MFVAEKLIHVLKNFKANVHALKKNIKYMFNITSKTTIRLNETINLIKIKQ